MPKFVRFLEIQCILNLLCLNPCIFMTLTVTFLCNITSMLSFYNFSSFLFEIVGLRNQNHVCVFLQVAFWQLVLVLADG